MVALAEDEPWRSASGPTRIGPGDTEAIQWTIGY
jgi:hypothetical protein